MTLTDLDSVVLKSELKMFPVRRARRTKVVTGHID